MSAAYPRNVTNIIPLELIVVKKETAPGYIDANPCIKVILINKRDNIIQYANVFLFIIYSLLFVFFIGQCTGVFYVKIVKDNDSFNKYRFCTVRDYKIA